VRGKRLRARVAELQVVGSAGSGEPSKVSVNVMVNARGGAPPRST